MSGTRPMTRQLAVNIAACALLLVQYLLGMAVNLFVVTTFKMVLQP